MEFHRRVAYEQLVGYLAVCQAICHRSQHFQLAVGKLGLEVIPFGLSNRGFDQRLSNLRGERWTPCMGCPDCAGQLISLYILE